MHISRAARPIMLGLTTGWLMIGLAVAGLLGGLTWSDGLVAYPGAERLAAHFQVDRLPRRTLSEQSTYETGDDLPEVEGWYVKHFGLGHDQQQGENCITLTRVDARLFLEYSLTVTLCSQPKRTLILVNRSLAVR